MSNPMTDPCIACFPVGTYSIDGSLMGIRHSNFSHEHQLELDFKEAEKIVIHLEEFKQLDDAPNRYMGNGC